MFSEPKVAWPDSARREAHAHACGWSSPLRRGSNTFFKLLYRWTHTRAFRHNERLSHGVSIARDEQGRLAGMRIRRQGFAFANAPLPAVDAAACHLIATGPSVKEIDYEALPVAHVMGVNGAIALQQKHALQFDYYCVVDAGFVRRRPDLIERIVGQTLILFTTPLVLWYIAQCVPLERIRCSVFLIEDVLYPAGQRALTAQELGSKTSFALFDAPEVLGFSFDIRRGVFDGRTVAYTGLQVLASLGFREIFMHGVDLVDAAHTPRFYESRADMQPSSLDDHFSAFVEPSFRHAAALLRSRSVQVMNLSMGSALGEDIFPKVRWQTLVSAAPRHPVLA